MDSDEAEPKDSDISDAILRGGDLSKAGFGGTVMDRVEPDEEAIK